MKNYYLFLDELKPNINFNHFCLAGCIVNEDIYLEFMVPFLRNLKKTVFGDDSIILHEIEMRKANEGIYKLMRQSKIREAFWAGMEQLFSLPDLFLVLGVSINCAEYHRLYPSHYRCDEYFIGLQIIMENYVHFLESVNSKGSIYVESRNAKEDERLQNHFFTLKATGTLFLDKNSMQKRLGTINFPLKSDNNIGLQIADFIPNPLARNIGGLKQKNPSLFPFIYKKLYDGNVNMPNRFGVKLIP